MMVSVLGAWNTLFGKPGNVTALPPVMQKQDSIGRNLQYALFWLKDNLFFSYLSLLQLSIVNCFF